MPAPVMSRRLLAGIVVILLAVVGLLDLYLHVVGPFPGDRYSLRYFHTAPRAVTTPGQIANDFCSVLGTGTVALPTVAFLAWTVAVQFGRRAGLFVLVCAAGVAVNAVIKVVLGPTPLLAEVIGHIGLYNYPSGHVAYTTSLFGGVAWLAFRHRRWDLAVPAVVLILVMGPSRVFGGAHFPSDVIAAYTFGAAWTIGAVLVVDRWPRRRDQRPT